LVTPGTPEDPGREKKYKPQFHPTLFCLETLHGVREKSEKIFKLRTEMKACDATIGRNFLRPVEETLEVRIFVFKNKESKEFFNFNFF
jgi:hypothetical protein